jgi:CheY-like chemotaxis protein
MSAAGSTVLYAEDSEDDAFLMQRAFAKVNFPASLTVARDGAAAVKYLDQPRDPVEPTARPCLILLDIKMPRLGGIEVLRWLRARAEFQNTRVILLTSSSQAIDISASYASGADCYLVKPTSLATFGGLVQALAQLCASGNPRARPVNLPGAVAAP